MTSMASLACMHEKGCRKACAWASSFPLTLITAPNIVHAVVQNVQALSCLVYSLYLVSSSYWYFSLSFILFFFQLFGPSPRETCQPNGPRTSPSLLIHPLFPTMLPTKTHGCRGRSLSLFVQCDDEYTDARQLCALACRPAMQQRRRGDVRRRKGLQASARNYERPQNKRFGSLSLAIIVS